MKSILIACATAAIGIAFSSGSAIAASDTPAKRHTVCIEVYLPVCGKKGNVTKTYSNACFAKADGAKVVAQGPCHPGK